MDQFDDPIANASPLTSGGTSEAPINLSEEDSIGREPASKTLRLKEEANKVDDIPFVPESLELLADSTAKSFTSGGNYAYDIYKRFERELMSPPPDPEFNADNFIKKHRKEIPGPLEMQFRLANSEGQASLILDDMKDSLRKQEILSRRGGFNQFVASAIAGTFDIDTPITLLSGGLSSGAKAGFLATKWGRMTSGAAGGAFSQGVAGTLGFEAGTTGDWTSIPAAGFGGMAFGMLGGSFRRAGTERAANASILKAANEFGETVAEGAPLAKDLRNEVHLHDDPYGSVKAAAEEAAAKEAAKAEEKAAASAAAAPEGVSRKPQVFSLDDIETVIPDTPSVALPGATMRDVQGEPGGSVGARQLTPQGSIASIDSPRVLDMITKAKDWAAKTGIPQEYLDKYVGLVQRGQAGDVLAKAATRFHDFLAASPLATDFDRMWRSGSSVAQRTAYDLLESASGIVRNNRSAAALQELYRNKLGFVSDEWNNGFKLWAKDNGISNYERLSNPAHREKFNDELRTELASRAYDGVPSSTSAGIKHAADKIDEWSKLDLEISRGRPGEGAMKGAELYQHYMGYFPQKWNGDAIEKLLRSGRYAVKDVIQAVSEGYQAMHGFNKKDADIYASAVVNRSRRYAQGMDVNLIGILQQDGKEFLAETLKANGLSDHAANRLIDKLTGEAAQRGQAAHTKGRIDIDPRFTASNGIRIMDIMDNDIKSILDHRVRTTAGAAALARKGIASRADLAAIKEAILAEQQALGKSQPSSNSITGKVNDLIDRDKHLTGDDIDAIFSNFTGGPLSGGINPYVSVVKKLTNLALLPQLGLTQMAEVGAQISAVGLKRWFEHAGAAIRGDAINPKSELFKELKHMSVLVPEERFFRNDLAMDMDRQGPASSWFLQKMQSTLNAAQHLEGYTSLFYQVRNFQQRVAATSAADKVLRNMAGLANDLSAERARDIGLTPELYRRIQKYTQIPNGTKKRTTPIVEFKDGSLHKMNLHRWKPKDVEDFSLALNRHVNQVVQKAMAGESSILFHKDGLATLFVHLKTFSLLSVEKQFLRNVKHQDAETVALFFAGLATAAAAYGTKQAINGNTQNLTASKLAKGAIGYSNMMGWMPMWTDPIASLLGFDGLRINNYGSRGQASDILSAPAAIPTMNKMLHIPAIPGHALMGTLSNNDVRAAQTLPVIGSAYGATMLLNSLKN